MCCYGSRVVVLPRRDGRTCGLSVNVSADVFALVSRFSYSYSLSKSALVEYALERVLSMRGDVVQWSGVASEMRASGFDRVSRRHRGDV